MTVMFMRFPCFSHNTHAIFVRKVYCLKDIISLFIMYFVRLGVPILTIPILSRNLNSEELSTYVYMQSIVAWVTVVVEFGFSYSATRVMSQEESAIGRNDLANSSNLIKAMIAIFLSILAFLFGDSYFYGSDNATIFLSLIVAFSIAFVPHSVYQVEEKLYLISKAEIVGSVLMLFSVLILSVFSILENAFQVMLAWLVIRTIILIYLYIKQRDYGYKISFAGLANLVETMSISLGAAVFKLTSSLYTSGNVMILTSMLPVSDVALFAAVDKFIRAGQGMLGPLSTVFYARIVKGKANIKMLLICQLLVAFFVVLALYFCSNIIESWFYSNKFLNISGLIYLYSPVIIIISINNTYGVNGLLADGHSRLFNIGIMSSAFVNFVLMILLVPLFGLKGAIISILVSETICAIYMVILKIKLS